MKAQMEEGRKVRGQSTETKEEWMNEQASGSGAKRGEKDPKQAKGRCHRRWESSRAARRTDRVGQGGGV